MPIDTDKFSHKLRNKGINIPDRKILVTNFNNSLQEKDFSVPSNCGGFGRIRHFRTDSNSQWGVNPLPIYPALKALNRSHTEQIKAQVFQNAICNWRCWYCYVDFKLLSGDLRYSEYLSCDELLDLFLLEDNRPDMIDLSGGQPDLTPEWVPWMMQVLIDRGMDNNIYLWSDDNLSNDYFWRYLSDSQIDLVSNYKMYGRVCCFKGFDEESFSINTEASPELFSNQFDIFKRLLNLKIDLYCYVTLTCKVDTNFEYKIPAFIDRLQEISENLPLRVIPLKIYEFSPSKARAKNLHRELVAGQEFAFHIWCDEIGKRFSPEKIATNIVDINI